MSVKGFMKCYKITVLLHQRSMVPPWSVGSTGKQVYNCLAQKSRFERNLNPDHRAPEFVHLEFSFILNSINLANVVGLRARSSLKPDLTNEDDEDFRPWRRRLLSSVKMNVSFSFTWSSAVRASIFLLLLGVFAFACFSLPVEKILKDFLLWIKTELGPLGPLVLAIAYIPLTVFAVPASVLTLGGGYLFGLPVGFVADSIGATLGATAAFLVGKTIGRSYVISKLRKYPKFQAIAIAIQRSGFKIVLLLRFVPLLPFNVLNYLLSVTPVRLWEYMLATWLGMMPITFVFVYIGTTLKDLSDVTHGWHEISRTLLMIVYIIRVAKASLEKALAENGAIDGIDLDSPGLPILADSALGLHQPLISTTADDLV
ncbi:SNARE associated Golgi protein [Cynara cardunculus var. scolymus]|uniref:SNARE associated Golgi protein n=1 Tax=Cynara cardunculus var. scolymus TaxID=59895 RepID=A0A103Y7H0_CYNCS|nr:SNARE associated Golgi protein [Cynara cardunculus var. scolymus]